MSKQERRILWCREEISETRISLSPTTMRELKVVAEAVELVHVPACSAKERLSCLFTRSQSGITS